MEELAKSLGGFKTVKDGSPYCRGRYNTTEGFKVKYSIFFFIKSVLYSVYIFELFFDEQMSNEKQLIFNLQNIHGQLQS